MSKEFKPLSGREHPRFSAIKTFFRLPQAEISEEFDVAIAGVPYDGSVSYRPGARFAPTRVRELSALGRGYHWTRGINFTEKIRVADIGDCSTVPIDQAQTYQLIESFFSQVLSNGKKFLAVGGDHSTTLPLLRAQHKKWGQPLQLIHFDAHLDTYPAAWGCEYHHGSFVRHAVEEGLIDSRNSYQFGIRGPLASGGDLDFVNKHGLNVFTVDDIRNGSLSDLEKKLPAFDSAPVYISFDIDCLDPAYAPGTGTPVPGGLTSYEVQRILRALNINQLVGADVVEVSPPFDSSDITSIAAVDVMFELLCLFAASQS